MGWCFWGGEVGGKWREREAVGLWGVIFREVREVIGLVFLGRKWGKWREREVVGLWESF